MKTLLWVLGGLFLFSKLQGAQASAAASFPSSGLSYRFGIPGVGEVPYGGAAGEIVSASGDPYGSINFGGGGAGGVAPNGIGPGVSTQAGFTDLTVNLGTGIVRRGSTGKIRAGG